LGTLTPISGVISPSFYDGELSGIYFI